MDNELSDRQQAVKFRLAGRTVEEICGILGRSPAWFHLWWRRYRMLGPNGLFDLTRSNVQPRRISAELERSIVEIRQRLASQTHPGTRYSLIGASSIVAELQVLHIHPLPSVRQSSGCWNAAAKRSRGWPDRGRFVLSCGHASMLLYSLLHLSGYGLTLYEIRDFRQWNSPTPGHPERGHTAGVGATTGPLGQGVGNAVGMALAERLLGDRFNRPDHVVVDHRTWAIVSDGLVTAMNRFNRRKKTETGSAS